jgi:hypothetical protein
MSNQKYKGIYEKLTLYSGVYYSLIFNLKHFQIF